MFINQLLVYSFTERENKCYVNFRILKIPYLIWQNFQYTALYRGGVSSTRGLGPTMTARNHIIGIWIDMPRQTPIVSRLDQLS
jgi:hypothetical protein